MHLRGWEVEPNGSAPPLEASAEQGCVLAAPAGGKPDFRAD